jgi:hypothetical protein
MRSKLNIWLALVVLALVPALAGAQDTTAKIHGHVQDPANAPIPNAQVILSTDGKTALFTFLLRHALFRAWKGNRPL